MIHAAVLKLRVSMVADDVALVIECDVQYTQVLRPGEALNHQGLAVSTAHNSGVHAFGNLVGRRVTL